MYIFFFLYLGYTHGKIMLSKCKFLHPKGVGKYFKDSGGVKKLFTNNAVCNVEESSL